MAISSALFKLFCVGLLGLLVLAPHAEAAISCSAVYSSLSPCLSYIEGGALSYACCPGIRGLYSRANTKPDRQSVCGCLKNLANNYRSRLGRAQSLLKLCGVTLPYPLSPSIDCSQVN